MLCLWLGLWLHLRPATQQTRLQTHLRHSYQLLSCSRVLLMRPDCSESMAQSSSETAPPRIGKVPVPPQPSASLKRHRKTILVLPQRQRPLSCARASFPLPALACPMPSSPSVPSRHDSSPMMCRPQRRLWKGTSASPPQRTLSGDGHVSSRGADSCQGMLLLREHARRGRTRDEARRSDHLRHDPIGCAVRSPRPCRRGPFHAHAWRRVR